MNLDYSKAFELLSQDAEKERNKKAEKAAHDNLYNKGVRDGLAVLDKIRADILNCLKALDEIEKSGFNIYLPNEIAGRRATYQQCLRFIDKYKAESEEP